MIQGPLLAILLLALAALPGRVIACDDHIDLTRGREPGIRNYLSSTDFITYAPDGTISMKENLSMKVTISRDTEGVQSLKCLEFQHTTPDGMTHTIPALSGWSHKLSKEETPEVLGIHHGDFAALKYENGDILPPDVGYRVYNTFVDFYAFNNVFAENAEGSLDRSIGALKTPGQIIEHYSANSKPPVNLGDAVKEGSYFQNGNVTMQFKGWSKVNDTACILVGFDSGDSSLMMLMEPAPGTPLRMKGGSHYWGELYINNNTLWVEESSFREIILSEMKFGDNPPMSTVGVRDGHIKALD